jgi:ECF transporter S component (folate family)
MKKSNFTAKRLVLDAVLIALYVLLGLLKIPIGNMLRINLASFAVIICAVSFGPVDGLIVGFMGEFLSQVLGPYGLTPTTALWALPEAVRGLSLGFVMLALRKDLLRENSAKVKYFIWYLIACVLTGITASLLNTLALYIDSKMFGYYNYYMVFGVLLVRLSLAVVLSGLFGYITLPIASALRRNKLI